MHQEFERYKPMLEKYELASQANSFLKQRKILRQTVDKAVDK